MDFNVKFHQVILVSVKQILELDLGCRVCLHCT